MGRRQLITLRDGLGAESLVARLLRENQTVSKMLIDLSLELQAGALQQRVDLLRMTADELREQAGALQRERRSGNPALRGPAKEADLSDMHRTASGLKQAAEVLDHSPMRHLPLVGTGLGIGMAGASIASGDSPSSVIVTEASTTLGVVAGGALVVGGAALVGVSAPALLVGTVAVGAGIVVGIGAEWAYENWVPQDVRESIDAGLEDAWDATTDFADDAWESLSDGASGAWKSVFG